MATRQYIGARYVPIIMGDWDASQEYEPLSVVLYNGSSYTTKRQTPAGTLPTNTIYWALTGNYNAQIDQFSVQFTELKAHTVKQFDTVIDMAQEMEILDIGDVVRTAGYYQAGDMGAAWYVVRLALAQDVYSQTVDGSTSTDALVRLAMPYDSGVLVAELIRYPVMTPEQFGAYGDGVHDDTDALNIALSFSSLKCGNEYLLSDIITVPSERSIDGGRFIQTVNTKVFRNESYAEATKDRNIIIRNLVIDCSAVTTYNQTNDAVWMCGVDNLLVENVDIINPASDGIYIGSNNTQRHNSGILIENVRITNFHRQGISIIDGLVMISNCSITAEDVAGLTGASVDVEPNQSYEIVRCSIRNSKLSCGVSCINDHAETYPEITVLDCAISRNADAAKAAAQFKDCHVTLERCYITGIEDYDYTVTIYHGGSGVLRNCTVLHGKTAVRFSAITSGEVVGCDISADTNGVTNDGCVQIISGNAIHICENILRSIYNGIVLRNGGGNVIRDNLITGGGNFGIYCNVDSHNRIDGNRIDNTVQYVRSITATNDSTHLIIVNNDCAGASDVAISSSGTGVIIDNNITA